MTADPVAELADSSEDIVTITVEEQVTIFRGPDTVYRYDLPASGIIEGWALLAVVDQARELVSLRWPDVEVVVDADAHPAEILIQALLNKGVVAYPAEAVRETALPDPYDGPISRSLTVERPTSGAHRRIGLGGGVWRARLFPVAVAGLVAVVVGVSWLALGGGEGEAASADDLAGGEPGSGASSRAVAPKPSPASTAPAATPAAATPAATMVHEVRGMRVATPPGFHVEPVTGDGGEGAVRLVGEDDALRILVAVDPIYSVPPPLVMQEVVAMIEADATLEPVGAPGEVIEEGQRVRYREVPGDGSEVAWLTWVATGQQFSVGCQTRTAPTIPQQAACRIAEESLELF